MRGANETCMALLAKSVGLPVADVQLRATPKARIAVIVRYDRVLRDGVYYRLHQEDFYQALGISPSSKYQKEGGPSLKQCAEVIRRHAAFPLVDLNKFLHWALFNWLAGGTADPDHLVGARHLEAFAADLKLRPKLVLGVADAMLEQIANALDSVSASFVEQHGDSPIVERVAMVIRKQIWRARTLWK
jgi:hypothetical protein